MMAWLKSRLLNLIWKFPGFVPFGANLTHFGAKSGNRDWDPENLDHLSFYRAEFIDQGVYTLSS